MKSFEDLEKLFERGLEAWQQEIVAKEAERIGVNAAGEVKKLTPVKTGLLRRRWSSRVETKSGETIVWVINNTVYGPAVNYGHRIVRGGKTVGKTKGKYMLENGIYQYRRKILRKDIERMLNRLREVL